MKRWWMVTAVLVVLSALVASIGCQTWSGMGKDVKGVGESMEKTGD